MSFRKLVQVLTPFHSASFRFSSSFNSPVNQSDMKRSFGATFQTRNEESIWWYLFRSKPNLFDPIKNSELPRKSENAAPATPSPCGVLFYNWGTHLFTYMFIPSLTVQVYRPSPSTQIAPSTSSIKGVSLGNTSQKIISMTCQMLRNGTKLAHPFWTTAVMVEICGTRLDNLTEQLFSSSKH